MNATTFEVFTSTTFGNMPAVDRSTFFPTLEEAVSHAKSVRPNVSLVTINGQPLCPDCGRPTQWAEEFGTGRRVPAVCDACDDFYAGEFHARHDGADDGDRF